MAPAKSSWADIVKGSKSTDIVTSGQDDLIKGGHDDLIKGGDVSDSKTGDIVEGDVVIDDIGKDEIAKPLQPAERGSRQCVCRGEVLAMLGFYGWIASVDEIDHPDVDKNGGRIYVHRRDVADGAPLVPGDIVVFFLYADDQGLGAECVRVEQRVSSTLSAEASEFVPAPAISVSTPTGTEEGAGSGLRLDATEFVPGVSVSTIGHIADFVPISGVPKLSACENVARPVWQISSPWVPEVRPPMVHGNTYAINQLIALLDDSSDEEESDASCDGDVGDTKGSSCDGSTSEGGSSSDAEDFSISPRLPEVFRPPPGLCLPPGLSPPPGLCA